MSHQTVSVDKGGPMKRDNWLTYSGTILSLMLLDPSMAIAGQSTLEFKLVTKAIEVQSIDVPNLENQRIGQGRAIGVATFKDGRIAIKNFVFQFDENKNGTSSTYGYSTYTFDDGSTITARFSDQTGPNQAEHGEYKILSGTGAYAGATGTGSYDSIQSSFKSIGLYAVKLVVMTP